MLLTVPFVLYRIFRVLLFIHHTPTESDEPAIVLWRDRSLLSCVLLWALTGAAIAFATR
jgi:hypothetical protein